LRSWRASGFEAHHTPVQIGGIVRASTTTLRRRVALIVRLRDYRLPGGCRVTLPAGRPIHLRLSVPLPGPAAAAPWHPGDTIAATARLGPPRQFRNPGAFRYAAYLKARGIDLLGSVKSVRLMSLRAAPRATVADLLPAVRRAMIRRLHAAAGPGQESTAAFLTALLVGERNRLAPDLKTSLQHAGVYHIVALSGLHVGLVVLLLGGLLRLSPLAPLLRRGVMIACIVLYAGLVRDSGSIARAALMATLYLGAGMVQRRLSPIGVIGVAAALLLCARPAWIEDAGFHLTFAATLGVVAMVPRTRGERPAEHSVLGFLRRQLSASVRLSTGVLVATAPLTACHFHIVAPAALLMNLIAVPLAALLLMIAIVISLVQPACTTVAHLLCRFASTLIELLVRLADGVAALPGAWFHVLPPHPVMILGLGFVALLLAAGDRPLRRLALATALVLSLRLVAVGRGPMPPHGALEVTLLDVGQGDSILLRLPTGLTVLIDAGGFPGGSFDVGARVVAPALRTLGILRLDLLVLTHAHTDHLGGAPAVVREFAPRAIWVGGVPHDDPSVQRLLRLAEAEGIPVVFPRRGVRINLGGSLVEVLNPGGGEAPNRSGANRGSLAMRIGLHYRNALLTGDLERDTENELLRTGYDLQADLLKVGHHGSRTSTSTGFLAAVAPEIALISVGSSNPWGHPHKDVIERLLTAGSIIHRSDRDGAVRYRTDGHAPWIAVPFSSPRGRVLARFRTPAE
jgi:competence protein ComEC